MFSQSEQAIIDAALSILEAKLSLESVVVDSPSVARRFCRLQIGMLPHEVFAVMFLTNQHQLISFKTLFRGTIDGASVYPREVVKEALAVNAASVVLSHNHPSGICEPSDADIQITKRLVEALGLVDIRVLDHMIVSPRDSMSFAERGLL